MNRMPTTLKRVSPPGEGESRRQRFPLGELRHMNEPMTESPAAERMRRIIKLHTELRKLTRSLSPKSYERLLVITTELEILAQEQTRGALFGEIGTTGPRRSVGGEKATDTLREKGG